MEQFLFYQLKVALLAAVLVLLYKVFLGKQTFHRFNRIMLLLIAVVSVTLPLVRIDALKTDLALIQKPIFSTQAPKSDVSAPVENTFTTQVFEESDEETFISEAPAEPASSITVIKPAEEPAPMEEAKTPVWVICLIAAYGIGLLCFVISYVRSLGSVKHLIDEGRYADRREGCDLIESEGITQPMNWMHYIVMPHQWLESKNQSMVWQHEYLHASKFHSLDLLLADLLWAMQWFNPAMKLLHGEFELIHEYEADQAVLDHGTDATNYKLMLVGAVASAKGIKMGNWLRQTKLKNRIDMMDRKKSSSWNMLKALFIPIISAAFLFANAQDIKAQDQNFRWPVFEDGKVWIFQDGSAKVKTFDHAEASMKVSEVAKYLKNYEGYKTTRMTLMYMYPIESLAEAQPLAEELLKAGIRINVANNEEMLSRMTMPEFRLVRIYGPDTNGEYRFEMICNVHEERLLHTYTMGHTYKYQDLSITGDMKLMLKWIDLFDGHGLAIYPSDDMPVADLQKIADAAWKRDIEQVSVVNKEKGIITFIPQDTKLTKEYGGLTVLQATDKINEKLQTLEGGEEIKNPRSSNSSYTIAKVIRTKDKTALVTTIMQGPDLWITAGSDMVIKYKGQEYPQYDGDGLKGFEHKYYWSPDRGIYNVVFYFPGLPEDAQVVNLCDADGEVIVKNLQVSNSLQPDFYDQFKYLPIDNHYMLKTLPKGIPDGGLDNFAVNQIEFTNSETTIYCGMTLGQAHSFPGFVGDDFILTFEDGKKVKPIRIEGVPVGKDFDRHGDFVTNGFQIVFNKLDIEMFQDEDNVATLSGSICHEPVTVSLAPRIISEIKAFSSLEPGEYGARVVIFSNSEGWTYASSDGKIALFKVESNGTITIKGDPTNHFADGSYTISVTEKNNDVSIVELKGKGNSFKFRANDVYLKKKFHQAMFVPNPEDGTTNMKWELVIFPPTREE